MENSTDHVTQSAQDIDGPCKMIVQDGVMFPAVPTDIGETGTERDVLCDLASKIANLSRHFVQTQAMRR